MAKIDFRFCVREGLDLKVYMHSIPLLNPWILQNFVNCKVPSKHPSILSFHNNLNQMNHHALTFVRLVGLLLECVNEMLKFVVEREIMWMIWQVPFDCSVMLDYLCNSDQYKITKVMDHLHL